MSKPITHWIQEQLYPALFERVESAFSEHQFKRFSGGYRSKTYIDGTPHKERREKTVITKKQIGKILEQGGESLSLVDYVMRRDSSSFMEAVKTLAEAARLQVPDSDFSPEQLERDRKREGILESSSQYFIDSLKSLANEHPIKQYLLQDRGYSSTDIETMGLGFIPSKEELLNHLKAEGHHKEEVVEVLGLQPLIGDTHQLTISYRSAGVLKGFKFRSTTGANPKYLNTKGLDRSGGFFNLSALKEDKDLVIVEGELDSLHSTAKGIANVVATGGSSINAQQISHAITLGAKSFTLCFDYERGKEEDTAKNIDSAIEVILAQGVNNVYIVSLEDIGAEKTDPDSLIKVKGVEAFRAAIREAEPYYLYQLNQLLLSYAEKEELEGGSLTQKSLNGLLDKVVTLGDTIREPLQRDLYKKTFTDLPTMRELGISEASLTETLDRLQQARERQEQHQALKGLLSEAGSLQEKGDIKGALDLLQEQTKKAALIDKATEFSELLKPTTEEAIKKRQAEKPESIATKYTIEGEELFLPSGALSIVAGPTSHGKTTFLINLALDIAQQDESQEIHFFTYEEEADSIIINSFNSYLGRDVSNNNRRSIAHYFKTGSEEMIKAEERQYFREKKEAFFKEIIEPGRLKVHYSSYDSETLCQAIRHLKNEARPKAIFIDYIQLLSLPQEKGKGSLSRQEQIKQIVLSLLEAAVETNLPIILGAQFNREVVNQLRLHPTKIGEAGDIERQASLVIGIWNNNFSSLGTEPELNEINQKGLDTPGRIYAKLLKNRTGKANIGGLLKYNGNTGRITPSESDHLIRNM